jgi:hypothetical protein
MKMDPLLQDVRDEVVRGVILSILVQHKLSWVGFASLKREIQMGQGFPITDDDLRFQLAYLGDTARAYVEAKPLRTGRADAFEYAYVRATAKAVDLRAGRIPTDPGVGL